MRDQKEELIATLRALSALLASHDEGHWSKWIDQDIACLEAADAYGLEHLLSAFGGMGSLNDVILRLPKQQDSARDNAADDEFWRLKEKAWELARELQRAQT